LPSPAVAVDATGNGNNSVTFDPDKMDEPVATQIRTPSDNDVDIPAFLRTR
jgi:hypothetical protein